MIPRRSLLASVLSLFGCDAFDRFQPMDVKAQPFAPGRKGSILNVPFTVPGKRYVGFYLLFRDTTPFLERATVLGSIIRGPNGHHLSDGIPIPLNLNVVDDASNIVLSKITSLMPIDSSGFGQVWKIAAGITLTAGSYTAKVEALSDISDLDGATIDFVIRSPARK